MKWFTSRVRRFWHWVGKFPKKITVPIMVIILAAISFGGYQFVNFYDYMQHDPNFCNSCHIMEQSWDRWASSEHKDVGCHSCHQQSLVAGAKLIIDFALFSYDRIESHAVVRDEACESCHESGNSEWIQVTTTAGHQVHAEEQNIACTKCHSLTLHRFEAPGPICNVCHEEKHLEVSGMAPMHCAACHEYLVEEEQLLPLRGGCLDCHQALAPEGVTWPADAPMQYPCGDCHQPHEQAEPMVDCQSCHTVTGTHLEEAHDASPCQTCHEPHQWQVTERQTCLTCHPGQAEHNADILCNDCHNFPAQ